MGELRTPRRVRNHPQNCKGSTNKKFIYYEGFWCFLLRVLLVLLWDCLFLLGLPYIPRYLRHFDRNIHENRSIWYSTGSSPGDLPNEREIRDSFICEQFFYQNSLAEPPYKISRKQLKVSIAKLPQGFWEILRLQLAALIVQRPKHHVWPCCTTIFHGEISLEGWWIFVRYTCGAGTGCMFQK